MFSSKKGVASLMPWSTLSAMWNEKPMQSPSPGSPSRPARARASRKAWTTFSLAPPGAAPPPMMPRMSCLAMKSSARALALTTGCQHSTGSVFGRGNSVISSSS